jgi:hypothetical protein
MKADKLLALVEEVTEGKTYDVEVIKFAEFDDPNDIDDAVNPFIAILDKHKESYYTAHGKGYWAFMVMTTSKNLMAYLKEYDNATKEKWTNNSFIVDDYDDDIRHAGWSDKSGKHIINPVMDHYGIGDDHSH